MHVISYGACLQVEFLTGQLADMQREVEDKGRLSSTLEATERSRKQVR